MIDINSFAINFVEDHPGFKYINYIIENGIKGEYKLLIPEILPFRAYWILTTKWGIEKQKAKEIIFDFVRQYSSPSYVGLKRESIIQANIFSNDYNHDIYDCYYLSLAIQENADSILTTVRSNASRFACAYNGSLSRSLTCSAMPNRY